MPLKSYYLLLTICFCCIANTAKGQDQKKPVTIGFLYGFGTQHSFPFHSKDYLYKPKSFKGIVTYAFKSSKKWQFEVFIEPAIYISKHQLLNKHYVKPSDAENYLELRDIYTKEKTINEYALGLGAIVRYKLLKQIDIHVQASIAPLISNTATERLDKGFAFSDVIGLGFTYNAKVIFFDVSAGLRHVSNADIKEKNSGHNNSYLEFGCRFPL